MRVDESAAVAAADIFDRPIDERGRFSHSRLANHVHMPEPLALGKREAGKGLLATARIVAAVFPEIHEPMRAPHETESYVSGLPLWGRSR